MFYSQFILAKKGPLGTIWIAAHLERKLRKNQVADTDIGLSVDSILFPEVPIALRLSSHLLLGVVRIYSRKVNYLFHDCSEALLKVKQAFRSTAVDLPPEESSAPYHSITLPETFHLDDFELPDSAFQGDFIDHHVSTKEQITLQDTMDGAGFSSMQFGLDERFGDGNASQIGLDLDEDIFLDKHLSSQHVSLSPSPHECSGHQHQSSSVFAPEMEIDNQNEFVKDENAEFSNDKPVLSNDYDRQNLEHKKKDDISSQCQGYSVQTPDLNEIFSTNDDLEEPLPDLIGCAHAPSTPGLEEDILNASAHESPAFSPLQKLSPSIGEANARLDECPYVMTDNDLVHGIAMDPDSINPTRVVPSPTSVSLEQIDFTTVRNETHAEYGKDTANALNSFLPGEAQEPLIDDQSRDPGEAILCNETQVEGIRLPTSLDESDPKVLFDDSVLDNGVIHTSYKISSDSVLASEEALVDKHAEDARPSCSSLEYIEDVNPVLSNSSFPLRSCTLQANLSNKPTAEDGAAVQKALQVSAEEQGVQSLESSRELYQDDDLGKDCLIANAADASLQVHGNFGDSVTEATLHIASSNELLAGHLQKDTHLEQLNCSSTSDYLEPEKMLLAPSGEQDQANDLSQLVSEKGVTESDGSVNRVSSLSGRKRPLDESAYFLQNASSAKLSARPRLKSNSEQIPDDDDLLASILVGKRTPLLRLGSTPPPAKEASLKRPRIQSRLGVAKRKVLLDDTTILHADVIRQQLINTEDIRRLRKKAPCTRPEIWMIQKSYLEEEIFDEPILTGISEKLTSLQTMAYSSKVSQHLYTKPSKEYDHSKMLELEATENEKNRADLVVQANKDSATDELCGPSGNEANGDKITDLHHEDLHSPSIPLQLDSSDNAASSKNLTKDSSEHEKYGLPSGSDPPCRLECEAGAHHITDEISLHNSNISTSLLEKIDGLGIQKEQASVDGLAQTGDEPFAVNDALSHSPKSACTEGLAAVVNPECVMADHEAQMVTDDANMIHVEGSYDATNSCIMTECKSTNGVLDSSMHEVEAANVTSSTDVFHTSSPLQSMLMQNDQLAELAVTADHQVMGDGESVLVAQLNDGTVKLLMDEENTAICKERPEETSECASQPNGGHGNAPSVVGETSDLQALHLEGDVVVESMPMDSTTAKETSDFCSAVDGNDTDFLNVDDEEEYEEAAGNDVPDTRDAQSFENSGWSSRTRGVARYLKTLFDEESGLGRKVVVMDQLIAGKTRKEASRMFFETLVLKTKDYIHVEQQNPCDFIAIKPRAKLSKSEF